MGGRSSRETIQRQPSSLGASSSFSHYGYPQSPYPQENQYYMPQQSPYPQENQYYMPQQYYTPQHRFAPSPPTYRAQTLQPHSKLDRRFSTIADNYTSLEEVTSALAHAGLESSNLIVGIDFTKSNEWTGKESFKRRSLHHIGKGHNPYEQAISIIGKTLSAFDEDNLIPCYGFGDASTHDQDVFSFYSDQRFCNGFEDVLTRYREILPHLRLAGPTSFSPIIEMAMTIVEQSGGQYHVLLIIADGQVTGSVNTLHGRQSPQEQMTIDAIVRASEYPLSIILVGVGDGPWDMMREFDDNIPARAFDNFQFVHFTEIMSKSTNHSRKQTEFALTALMEIPSQYKATLELNILGRRTENSPGRVPLPPPLTGKGVATVSSFSKPLQSSSFQQTAPLYPDQGYETAVSTAPSSSSLYNNHVCPVCLTNAKDMAFGCGHQSCRDCGKNLEQCPICRSSIQTRIRLY